MRKIYLLLILGIWIAILPYLGFPDSWKNVLATLSGLGLMIISYIFYKENKARETKKETFDNFSENNANIFK
ncbi:MAG: hypothetical protein NTZ87_01645 [Candidatus Nomurabacteria bacterium]|nr:hypothetical protein [Candidatus Nomurabacteria bacterium]